MIEKADGDYDGALALAAHRRAPSTRATAWCSTRSARILFLKRQYAEALAVLERVGLVDPEDLQMHYTPMLCYRGLGDAAKRRARRSCSGASRPTSPRRRSPQRRRLQSPEDNNERQPIHEHESVPLNPCHERDHVASRR